MARLALSVILSCIMASAVAAQDAIPETPPELRDFRLDPERAPPASQPQPEVQPPPVVQTAEPQPVERRPERAAPSQQRQVERPASTESDDPATTIEQQPEETAESVPAVVPPLPESTEPTSEAVPPQSDPSTLSWWQILAAIAAATMALIGGWLYLRRRADVFEQDDVQPAAAFEPKPTPTIMPQPVPTKPIANAGPRPHMSLEFIPDKATLGFNALTLKGRLQLVNNGNASADDMQLRATMISANQRQKETIAAFHSGAITIAPNALGSAKEGERLGLDIEMSVPVNELESYTVGGKRIFVPLMLASLQYAWADGTDSATIACMIGRETEPPQPKMGPLRLDLGPRSFKPLGQRPVYA